MGLRDWIKKKTSNIDKEEPNETNKAPGGKSKKEAFAGSAGWVNAKWLGSGVKSEIKRNPLFGKIFSILIIFLFMSAGYVSGYPLYISAWIGGLIWGAFNWIAYQFPGLVPIPDFFFSSAAQFTKGSFGAILNGIFGIQLVKNMGRGFTRSLISISFLWVWISMVFMIVYTGYIPLIGPSPIGLCGLHQTTNQMLGAPQVSCDPYEIGIQSNRLSGQIESNSLLNEILSPLEIKTDLGIAFKSDRIETEYIVNDDAGSTLTSIDPFKDTFTSFGSDPVLAEDIILLGNLKSKKLFVESGYGEENFVEIKLNPVIEENQCTCAGNVACIQLADESKNTFQSILTEREYNIDNVNSWCNMPWSCDIPGSEKIGENEFKVRSGYNQQIKCTHDGLAINESKLSNPITGRSRYGGLGKPFFVDFGISYKTSAVATKQLFIIDRSVVESQEDPLVYLNINSADVISKSLTDGKIEFGIGVDQKLDYLVPTYGDDKSPNMVLLGISIKNPRFSNGDVTNMNMNLEIYPDSDNIQFVCGSPEFDEDQRLKNSCSDGETTGNFIFEGREDNHYNFRLDPNRSEDSVLNSKTELYYITMFVDSEILAGSLYQGVFIQAEIDYEFESVSSTDLRISPSKF